METNLHKIRKNKKLSQSKLSKLSGISLRSIQLYEQKVNDIDKAQAKTLYKLAHTLNCNIEDLLENVDCNMKPLPIGLSDFKIISTNYYYVDKTLLIKDVIDHRNQVTLFTRPSGFGKTMNMDMLKVFFEKSNHDNSIYFKDKLIWKCGAKYRSYQGKYPVIHLSFDQIINDNWDDIHEQLCKLIINEFIRHDELSTSPNLNNFEIDLYNKYITGNIDKNLFGVSIKKLSEFLYKHYNQRCIIIIDGYDKPYEQAYIHDFYDKCNMFIGNLLSAALKDNPCIEFGFMSGVLNIIQANTFSGLNNIVISSIIDNNYSSYFGFTSSDVKCMLGYYKVDDKYNEALSWYGGYNFGNNKILNPLSLIKYISNDCYASVYYGQKEYPNIINDIITSSNIDDFDLLLKGKSLIKSFDKHINYVNLKSDTYNLYSYLLLTGYLTVNQIYPESIGYMCEISIPNKETNLIIGDIRNQVIN